MGYYVTDLDRGLHYPYEKWHPGQVASMIIVYPTTPWDLPQFSHYFSFHKVNTLASGYDTKGGKPSLDCLAST